MEMEVVELRKKVEKYGAHVKFNNSSFILDEILECQRSPCDQSGLGYNKEDENHKIGTWNSKKHEASTSFSKDESEVARHEHVQRKETMRRSEQEGHQGVGPTPQGRFRKKIALMWNQTPRYEKSFNGYYFSCNKFGHKALNCRSHARRSVGRPNNSVRCWTCKHTGHIASYC